MINAVSNMGGKSYKHIAKPILFKFSPDSVHTSITKLGKTSARIPPFRWALEGILAYHDEAFLGQTINGVYYKNPIGLSAGFDKNFELLKLLPCLGFGFVEGGSLTHDSSPGNQRPHYHRIPESKSILVNAGLNNDGVIAISKRIKKQGELSYPLNISVAKTNSTVANTEQKGIDDYIKSLKEIQSAKIGSIITLNISCPNAFGGEPFTDELRLENLLKRVDELHLNLPVYVKMPIDKPWPEFKKLLHVITSHNISGVTIGNLAKNRNNPALVTEIPNEWAGNMSGRPTFELSNALIFNTYKYYRKKLVIIGVGGIFSPQDAYEKIKNGASLVELITGLIFEGPQLIGQINKGLVELAKADGYHHISDAIGAHHK